MVPMTLEQVRQAVRAKRDEERPLPEISVERVSTDTRSILPGDLFIALRGDNFDAHDFLDKAHTSGATAAVVERIVDGLDLPQIVVPSARRALGDIAQAARRKLRHTKVVAVAGSNGKTTTKRLIHAALQQKLKGTASPASFNNDIGVPATLLPVSPRDDYVICECGTNAPGEIERLGKICEPDIAVITSIGEEHLEGLKDLQGVRRENMAITEGMNRQGLLIVHGDDKPLRALAKGFAGRSVSFGFDSSNDLFAKDIESDGVGVSFKLNGSRTIVRVPMPGEHNVLNALAAVAVARRLGVDDDKLLAGLATAEPPAMRMQRIESGGVLIINDAYNANPASMKAALLTLAKFKCTGRRIAVLGDMLELGEQRDAFHQDAGRQAVAAKVDALVTIGPGGKVIAEAAIDAGLSGTRVMSLPSAEIAAKTFAKGLQPGDVVLLKGSRGMKLEQIADAVVAARSDS